MEIIKQARRAFVMLLFFALMLNSGCSYDYTTGRGDLDPLPDGISFEIKFILDPEKTVDENGSLKQEIRDLFDNALPWITGEGKPATSMNNVNRDVIQQFVDTYNRDLFTAGWFNRVRHHVYGGNQERDVQLTFRRRINIVSGRTHMTEAEVQAVYMQAKRENLFQWAIEPPGNIADNVEIDWNYDSCTLTFSRSVNGIKFDAPGVPRYNGLDGSKKLLLDNLDRELMDTLNLPNPRQNVSEWYTDKIENGVLFGPAYIRRYRTRGTISKEDSLRIFGVEKPQRVDFDIEVMPFHGSYIVELSSSEAIDSAAGSSDWVDFAHVSRLRKFMHDYSLEAGILVPESGLKTSQILQTMRQERGPVYGD